MTDFVFKRNLSADIAYTFEPGERDVCVLYLHGWTSHHKTPKGATVQAVAMENKCSYLALDYTGHGESGGQLCDFTIGQGIQDTLDILNQTVQDKPLLIVGNSIGGWIGLWLSEQLKQTVGFVGLAPAPDITQFIWDKLIPEEGKDTLNKGGVLGPSQETKGFCFTKQLFEDAAEHFMLNRPIQVQCPVRLIVGDRDEHVSMDRINQIKNALQSQDVAVSVIKGANHHLSEPQNLRFIRDTIHNLLQEVS